MTLDSVFYSNTVLAWLMSAGLVISVLGLLLGVRRLVVGRLVALAQRTTTRWDDLVVDLLRRTQFWFLVVIALIVGASVLTMSDGVATLLRRALPIAFFLQAGVWGAAAARVLLERYRSEKLAEDRGAATTIAALGFLAQVVVWSAVVLLALDNAGVDVTALVASLGVGGVAIALATQNIFSDLFSSLAIVLDRPFVLGDFIVVGELPGTVEQIGIKTTRVRALSGEQLVFSNADLLSSRVRNFGRMQERRILFKLGVTYQTPRADLERIPDMIRTAVEDQAHTRFDRSHFLSFGDFSLDFETVYFVTSPDYGQYMDIQQAINLSIHAQFEDAGIEFAYPTQTLVLTRGESARREIGVA